MVGDILSRMTLNIADFTTQLNRAEAKLRSAMDKIESFAAGSSKKMAQQTERLVKDNKKAVDKVKKDHIKANKKIVTSHGRAARDVSRKWWSSFGRVALGFTIAYRAMNAFEVGIRKTIETIGDAIKESSDLAATQAKLAFWYQMHTKETLEYAEVFERAAVNIRALGEAGVYSVASLEEITTGLDELAQSVGAIPANMIPAMASMVDFTVMVAQTTGSTIRQVRQEFQALMEGRIKTTDVMARSLIKTGIMNRKELAQMRDMQNQAEILEKVMNAVHKRWSEARDIYREASIEAAKGFWEKALRMNIRLSVELASEMTKTGKVAGNLFAKVFVEHGERALKSMKEGIYDNVLMMLTLRAVLDKALTTFEKTLAGISWFVATLYRMSDELIIAVKALGGLLLVGVITKLIHGLGKAMLWLALGPIKILVGAVRLLNMSILRIPLGLYAAIVGVQAFFKTIGMSGEYLMDILREIPRVIKRMVPVITTALTALVSEVRKHLPEPIRATLEAIEWLIKKGKAAVDSLTPALKEGAKVVVDYWKPIFKEIDKAFEGLYAILKKDGLDFAKEFGKNFKDILLSHLQLVKDLLAPIWDKLSGDQKEHYKKMFDEAEKYLEGLGWLFKGDREETDKERKARERKERQLLSLRMQMEKDFYMSRLERIKVDAEAEYKIRIMRIRELTEAGRERDILEAIALKAKNEKLLALHGSFTDGLKRGILEYVDVIKTSFERASEYIQQILGDLESSLETTMGDAFYDAFTGQLKSIKDYYKAFALSFVRAWSNMITKMIMDLLRLQIMKSILGFVGGSSTAGMSPFSIPGLLGAAPMVGGVGHKGGIVGETPFPMRLVSADLFKNAVHLHKGLAPDEFPAILQKGELVIPKDEVGLVQERFMQVDIVNVWDDVMFDRYLATARGQDAIVNVIGARSQTLRRVMR